MSILDDYTAVKKTLRDLQNFKELLRGQVTSFVNSSVSVIGLRDGKEISINSTKAQVYLDAALRNDHARPIVDDAIALCQNDVNAMAEAAKAEYKRLFDEEFPAGNP